MMVKKNFFFYGIEFYSRNIFLDNHNTDNALLLTFLDAAQNQMIPPPPSSRELFPALSPFSSSGIMGDTPYTD
jgi:hypothetical protein